MIHHVGATTSNDSSINGGAGVDSITLLAKSAGVTQPPTPSPSMVVQVLMPSHLALTPLLAVAASPLSLRTSSATLCTSLVM